MGPTEAADQGLTRILEDIKTAVEAHCQKDAAAGIETESLAQYTHTRLKELLQAAAAIQRLRTFNGLTKRTFLRSTEFPENPDVELAKDARWKGLRGEYCRIPTRVGDLTAALPSYNFVARVCGQLPPGPRGVAHAGQELLSPGQRYFYPDRDLSHNNPGCPVIVSC